MIKNNIYIKLLLLFIFILLIRGSIAFALEIKPKSYPQIPFAPIITENSRLPDFVAYFFSLGIYLAGVLAVISLVVGGIQLIFYSVSPEARSNAIGRIKSAILGLVLLLTSVIIIQTINPTLKNIQNTVPLRPIGGVQLVGNNISKPAPKFASSLDEIRKNYSAISWPETQQVINPATNQEEIVPNCDPETSGAYIIYWYKEKELKNLLRTKRLLCGERDDGLGSANSYEIIKEEPGVYFYEVPDCTPAAGGDSITSVPNYSNQSIPEWSTKAIKSILVVNGPDKKRGPFFGAVIFNASDYRTAKSPFSLLIHIGHDAELPAVENYSRCVNTPVFENRPSHAHFPRSIVVYQWAGFQDNNNEPNINCSITLYSKSGWSGGYYDISTQSEGVIKQTWLKELAEVPVFYPPGIKIPAEEREKCNSFFPKENCLQSFEIKGNCLAIIAESKTLSNREAQAFPISPRLIQSYINRPEGYSIERGTPQLEKDFITSRSAYFILVIPLAKKLTE